MTFAVATSNDPAKGPITFRSQPGETAVIDGGCLTPSEGHGALIEIHKVGYVTIEGFEVRNYKTSEIRVVRVAFAYLATVRISSIELLKREGRQRLSVPTPGSSQRQLDLGWCAGRRNRRSRMHGDSKRERKLRLRSAPRESRTRLGMETAFASLL